MNMTLTSELVNAVSESWASQLTKIWSLCGEEYDIWKQKSTIPEHRREHPIHKYNCIDRIAKPFQRYLDPNEYVQSSSSVKDAQSG